MELSEILLIVQILSAAGSAALDVSKIAESIKKGGRTSATADEAAAIRALVKPHTAALSEVDGPTGFLWR